MGVAAGMSVALSIFVVGTNGALRPPFVFAIVTSVLGLVGLVAILVVLNPAIAMSSALVGAWLICLAIDLLVNENRGWSYGLRLALDYNPVHRRMLEGDGYMPPVSSRVLVGVAWVLGIVRALCAHQR